MGHSKIYFFVVGSSREAEVRFTSAVPNCDIHPVDNLDEITGYITSMPVFFLLQGHEQHPLWPGIRVMLSAFQDTYKIVEVPSFYDGHRNHSKTLAP